MNKTVRAQQPVLRMLPADQGFKFGNLPGFQVEDRLIVQEQPVIAAHGRSALIDRLIGSVADRLLETVYATAPIGMLFVDLDLRVVMINHYLAAIHGASALPKYTAPNKALRTTRLIHCCVVM